MNLTGFQTALKRYGFDDGDPLTVWINAAIQEFLSEAEWPFLEAESLAIPLAAGNNTVVVPSDFGKVITLKDVTGVTVLGGEEKELEYWDRRKWDREVLNDRTLGVPEVFTLFSTNIVRVWPGAQQDRTMDLLYQKTLTDLANPGDIPAFPTKFHYIPVFRAAAIALMAENEEERSQTAQAEYDNGVLKVMSHYEMRELGDFATTQDTQGYSG